MTFQKIKKRSRECQVQAHGPGVGPKIGTGRSFAWPERDAGLRMTSLMLRGYTAGLMSGSNINARLDVGSVQLGAVPEEGGGSIPPL